MNESDPKSKMKVVVRSSGAPPSEKAAAGGAERRRDGRVEMSGSVNVVYDTFREFISANAANVSRGGMFIPTREVKPVGSRLSFVLSLKDEFTLVRGRGEVVWTRGIEGVLGEPAGIAVRFLDIDETSLELIGRMTRQHQKEGGVLFSIDSEAPLAAPEEAPRAAEATVSEPGPPAGVAQELPSPEPAGSTPAQVMAPPPAASPAPPVAPVQPDDAVPLGAAAAEDTGGPGSFDPAATVLAGRPPAGRDQATAQATSLPEPSAEKLPPVEFEAAPAADDFRLPVEEPAGEVPEPEAPGQEWDEVWVYDEEGGEEVRPRTRKSRLLLLVGLLAVVGGGAGAYFMGLIDLPGLPRWGEQAVAEVGGGPEISATETPAVESLPADGAEGPVPAGETSSTTGETVATEETEVPPGEELEAEDRPAVAAGAAATEVVVVSEEVEESADSVAEPIAATQPAARSNPGSVVERIVWQEDDGVTLVTVEVDGFVEADRVFTSQLDAPPRQLIRLVGIDAAPEEHVLEVGGPRLERIRSWLHGDRRPPELHIVLDLSDDLVAVSEPVVTGSRVEFLIGGPSGR